MPDWLGRARLPLARALRAALLDPTTRFAVGVRESSRLARLAVHTLYAARRLAVRSVRPPRRTSSFTPGEGGKSVYPAGYTIGELGPS